MAAMRKPQDDGPDMRALARLRPAPEAQEGAESLWPGMLAAAVGALVLLALCVVAFGHGPWRDAALGALLLGTAVALVPEGAWRL